MVKVNDIVRFLNDVGGGRVSRIDGKMVYVEDEDGFERPALAREVVVVDTAKPHHTTYEKPLEIKSKLVEPDVPAPKPEPKPMEPVFETEEGEVLNIGGLVDITVTDTQARIDAFIEYQCRMLDYEQAIGE